MVKRERSRAEIIHDVLQVTLNEENARKTRIMQASYLNTLTFSKYFDFLLNGGFIAKRDTEVGCYEVTEKGKNLLKSLKKLEEIMMVIASPMILIPEMLI